MEPSGEVLSSFLNRWVSQSWDWKQFPSFGSIVSVNDGARTVVGIVIDIQTGSFDQSRVPFAFQKTIEELERDQPQIFSFLTTQYTSLVLGYVVNHHAFYQLPQEPITMHSFVSKASDVLIRTFFATHHYIPLLFAYQHAIPVEDLLLALIQHLKSAHVLTDVYLEGFIEDVYNHFDNDYKKLKLLIRRIEYELAR